MGSVHKPPPSTWVSYHRGLTLAELPRRSAAALGDCRRKATLSQHRQPAITIRDLLETPSLQLSVIAGGDGLDRPVAWTHVSELKDPALWLDGGELLMTNGLGLAREAAAQAELIARLDDRRAAGLGIGVRVPKLSREMHAEADRRSFPILGIPREVPFLAIARMVADANQDNAQRRLLTHVRIFDTLRPDAGASTAQERFVQLEAISGYRLHLLSGTGAPLFSGLRPAPPDVVELIREQAFRSDSHAPVLPGGYVVPVPAGREGAFLVAMEDPEREPAGLGAVRHIATVAALELTKLYVERQALRRRGAETLGKLFAGALDASTVESALHEAGFDPSAALIVFALRGTDNDLPEDEIDHRLSDLEVPHFVLLDGDLFGLIPAEPDVLPGTAAGLPVRVGVSQGRRGMQAWAVARKEALWGLERAITQRNGAGPIASFAASEASVHWLPTDMETLESLVEEILAPLLAYDREHKSSMFETLRVFFEHDRQLGAAASELYVHKHTLSYRLGRIEDITGRDLSRMSDLVPLWLALQAYKIVADRPATPPSR